LLAVEMEDKDTIDICEVNRVFREDVAELEENVGTFVEKQPVVLSEHKKAAKDKKRNVRPSW
jgi:hypothetical protein